MKVGDWSSLVIRYMFTSAEAIREARGDGIPWPKPTPLPGLPTRLQCLVNPEHVAIHEAGHADICVVLGGRAFDYVSIEPTTSHQGRVRYSSPFDQATDDVRTAALVAWSGAVASQMFTGLDWQSPEAGTDRENVIALMLMVSNDETAGVALAEHWYQEAWELVRTNEPRSGWWLRP
jgi:hypothetical protein